MLPFRRTRSPFLALLLLVLLLLAACGQPAAREGAPPAREAAPGDAAEQPDQPAEAPPARERLVIGAAADDYDQEPLKSRFPNYPTHTGACEPLLRLGPGYEIMPWLAERYEYVGDNTFRFYLREGVTFHDGTPFTAEAVKWSFERAVRGENNYIGLDEERAVTIVDEYTVDIHSAEENLRLPEQIVHPTWAILAPGTELIEKVVCTGPWQVTDYRPKEEVTLARYEGYWGEVPRLKELRFRFYPDDTTRLLALEAGEIDLMMNVPGEEVTRLSQDPRFQVIPAPVGRNLLMYLNVHGEEPYTLLQDINIRRAIGMAIDREVQIQTLMDGNAVADQLMAPRSILGEHADLVQGFTFDPAAATALLEQSGWLDSDGDGVREKEGRRLSLRLIGWPEFPRSYFEYIQASLAPIGIEVNIVAAPDAAAYREILNAGEFDIDVEGPNQNDGNPIFLPALRFYSAGTGPNIKFFAPGERFDALVEEAAATTDLEQVRRNSALAMQMLIDEEAIVIPLAGLFRIYAARAEVEGFEPHPSWNNQWYDTLYFSEE